MKYIRTFEEYSQGGKKCGVLKKGKKKSSDKEINTKESEKHFLLSTPTTQDIVKSFDSETNSPKVVNLSQTGI